MNRSGHLPFLDGIRGIAILAVFLFHSLGVSFGFDRLPWNGIFPSFDVSPYFIALFPITYGSFGVAMFFVVSGFCIHLSYKKSENQGWLKFFKRRFFRIYPPYFAAVFIFFFLWPWGDPQLAQLVTHTFLVHNLDPRTLFGINPSFWSIAVEIQLYAIYPVLIWLACKYGWKRSILFVGAIELIIRSVASIGITFFHTELPSFIISSPFAFWLSWSVGAYIAQCFLEGRSSRISLLRFDLLCLGALAAPLFRFTAPFAFLASSLLTGVVIERFLSGKWRIPKSGIPGTAWAHLSSLGVVSYSFYLLHQPLVALVSRSGFFYFSPLIGFSVCCLGYFPIYLLSHFFYRCVEQTSISLGKADWKTKTFLRTVRLNQAD